jgi:DNA-binding IclR family transcriptional regulator
VPTRKPRARKSSTPKLKRRVSRDCRPNSNAAAILRAVRQHPGIAADKLVAIAEKLTTCSTRRSTAWSTINHLRRRGLIARKDDKFYPAKHIKLSAYSLSTNTAV